MELENKLVSIIVPVYNAESFLERCWSSLKNQTYSNLEIIFVNDASTDGSSAYLQRFQMEDNRVIVLNQKQNSGVSAARNAGLDLSSGDYIGFCDSDDWYQPDMVASMVDSLEVNEADMACCAITRIRDDMGASATLWGASGELVMTAEEAFQNWLSGRYIGNSVCSKLSRRHLWQGVRFPKGEIFEEAYVIPQLLTRAVKVVHTGTSLYHYYYGHHSLASAPMNQRILAVFKREEYLRNYISQYFPGLEEAMVSYEVRNNLGCMIGAEISKNCMDPAVYLEVKHQFDRVFFSGLSNPYVSAKDKLRMIEVKTKLFYLRKKLSGQVLQKKQ